MSKKDDPYMHFELMHNASIVIEMFIERIQEHGAMQHADPKLADLADQIADDLHLIYNMAASQFVKHDPMPKEDAQPGSRLDVIGRIVRNKDGRTVVMEA